MDTWPISPICSCWRAHSTFSPPFAAVVISYAQIHCRAWTGLGLLDFLVKGNLNSAAYRDILVKFSTINFVAPGWSRPTYQVRLLRQVDLYEPEGNLSVLHQTGCHVMFYYPKRECASHWLWLSTIRLIHLPPKGRAGGRPVVLDKICYRTTAVDAP